MADYYKVLQLQNTANDEDIKKVAHVFAGISVSLYYSG